MVPEVSAGCLSAAMLVLSFLLSFLLAGAELPGFIVDGEGRDGYPWPEQIQWWKPAPVRGGQHATYRKPPEVPFDLQIKPPEGVNMLRNATFSGFFHLFGQLVFCCKPFPNLWLCLKPN